MRLAIRISAYSVIFALVVAAQTAQHKVTLTWVDTLNPAGTVYSVYRATGLCAGSPAFSVIASAIPTKTYEDNTVAPGNYCYAVTATYNSVESAQSNSALAPVPSFAPANLAVTVQ